MFEGAPDQSDEPWIKLADALGKTYPTAGGREKAIDLSGVDSGWATDRVYRFCATRPNVFALDGREPVGLPWLGTPVKKDIKDQRKRVVAKVLLYPVGLFDVKAAVVAGMANLVQGASEAGAWPRGTLHFGAALCDPDFAKEMTAERLVDADEEARSSVSRRARRLIRPKAGRQWKKIVGRVNDWFDATVYAFALGWFLQNKRRLTLDRWADLLKQVHGSDDEPQDLFAVAEENPFVKPAAKVTPKTDASKPAKSAPRKTKWKSYQ